PDPVGPASKITVRLNNFANDF
ncbi:hypothetical protein CP8484711_2012, partial [Chlamydia psittaci 84-8471/1]